MISVLVLIVCTFGTSQVSAKSVYAITDHHASTLRAYKIMGDQLEYQATVYVTNYASGAVDVTIDSNLELLFITYEDAGKIVWVNAKTLQQEGFIDLSGAPCYAGSLAGIVADEQKQRVHVVGRASNRLFILAWNVNQKKLMLMDPQDPNQPYSEGDPYVTLTDLEPGTGSWGIALDENTRRLYVGNNTANVHIYDVDNNWVHLGTRDVGRAVATFELWGPTTWSDLLDDQGTITIGYTQLVGPYVWYVESGFVVLNEATLIVEGTPVPEPATVIFLALGVLGLCVGRRRS